MLITLSQVQIVTLVISIFMVLLLSWILFQVWFNMPLMTPMRSQIQVATTVLIIIAIFLEAIISMKIIINM